MASFHDPIAQLGVPVTQLTADSRQVQPGDTFAAFPGEAGDGRKHIGAAVAAGANAVLWEMEGFEWNPQWQVPNLAIQDLRERIGAIASQVYGEPSQSMWVIGVTGTNGKTSCSHWLAQALTNLGRKTALVGTLGNGFHGALTTSTHTTPEAVSLQRQLADYLAQGAQCVAMEVSSHGLAQGRVNGVKFDVALLTNLTRDHLDYHGDMQSYARAKAALFNWPGLKHAVLNLDDTFGAELAAKLDRKQVAVLTYGIGRGDVAASNLRVSAAGVEMDVTTQWGVAHLKSPLIGTFNAANLLGVLAVLLVSGVKLNDAVQQLAAVTPPPGRMQRLGGDGAPLVVVDYAHTPDALEKVLQTLRDLLPQDARLICVFGCGGERDKGKRALMGDAASRLADKVVVTSDNPRSENARAIIEDILEGMRANYEVIEDRADAIFQAIGVARPIDVVLVAGKGHEAYQEIAGTRFPFSDAEVAARALQERVPC